jgi:hypothetical protein
MTAVWPKIAAIWAAFIPLAIINGLLREKCLVPLFGLRLALPLSGISCALLFFLFTYFSLPRFGQLKIQQYQLIGFAWLGMTILFEFLFGRIMAHKPWRELLQAYNILTGNLWILGAFRT